ncbi:hypothetical protein QR680_014177 [Steinernema hermaphroditum]|uniref:ApaG domain-containing protein n=1 Tax=Steinernema hermaphroditum TaxID=289476 RepID=A0AA39I7Y5_9BILA|nr:hypothetical protein QR680_014177 [Steinernema hermaphroditum]
MIANRNSSVLSMCVMRKFSTSARRPVRFRFSNPSPPPGVKEIGVFTKQRDEALYKPGQMFLHKAFAYRGIVICSFNCRVISKPRPYVEIEETMPYYQVLVHRGDWQHIKFPVDITSYLGDGSGRGEKLLTVINGMDCVAHNEVLPFLPTERNPFDHDLFSRLFEPVEATSPAGLAAVAGDRDLKYTIRKELMPNDLVNQRSWLRPQAVYSEVTDGVKVSVITFYLGTNLMAGVLKHCWRYVMRVENMTGHPVTLRERVIKVFSMNQLNQTSAHGIGVGGMVPILTPTQPVFQFSSTIDLQQLKGGQMWGKFKLEREDGSFFDVTIPNVALEACTEKPAEQTESVVADGAMDDDAAFPDVILSLTLHKNTCVSYESRRVPGHVFSFSAGSRYDRKERDGKPMKFYCLDCLSERGRLTKKAGKCVKSTARRRRPKRNLNRSGSPSKPVAPEKYGIPVAYVLVADDLTHFVEDPDWNAMGRHCCVVRSDGDVILVKKEDDEDEQLIGPVIIQADEIMSNQRERVPFSEVNQQHIIEEEMEEPEEMPPKRVKVVETLPPIIWSQTRTNLRKASYESVRFEGHTFHFREDACSRSRKGNRGLPKIFECMDCSSMRSRRSRRTGESGNIARVRISADYKEFAEDPDYCYKEHQCIPIITVNPPKGKQTLRRAAKPMLKQEPVEEEAEDNENEPIQHSGRSLRSRKVERALKKEPQSGPDWESLKTFKARNPYSFTDDFFAAHPNVIDGYFEMIHERFLEIVQEKHPTSQLKDFAQEWKKWKPALVKAAENMRNCAWKANGEVSDEHAFQLVTKFFADRSIMRSSAMEIQFHYIMIEVPFRTCIKEQSVFPRIVIVRQGSVESRYIAVARQLIPVPNQMPFPEIMRAVIESYVVFDLSVCPEVSHVVLFLEFVYGLQRSQMTPSMHALLMDTYNNL